ncbi:MAG TPA: M67 family metallopeptidase [Fodinibius sp.]|nr:M67 family metallopeptidase [Fodinibius sp.]
MIISAQARQTMRHHAEKDYPNECCGFFYGTDDNGRKVQVAQPVSNVKEGDQRRRFQIDPLDYQKAEQFAFKHELDLLGIYHSHPDHPAEPSEHDRSVALPYFSYIILGVENGQTADIRSWRLNEEHQFEEEFITTTVEQK